MQAVFFLLLMINGMNDLVFTQNEAVLTNSLLVAEKFKKEHRHVTDAIRKLMGCAENSAVPLMFEEATYINEQNGQEYPMFIMNRDGFTLLAMGFTGKKAMQFKLDYIAAFNAMEKALREQAKPKTHLEILVESAQELLSQSRRIEAVENKILDMQREREENTKLLLAVSVSQNGLPQQSVRDKVRQLVNRYATAKNIAQADVWHKVYDQLYYLFHISVNSYKKRKKESNLDVAERNGFMNKIYDIISNMVREMELA